MKQTDTCVAGVVAIDNNDVHDILHILGMVVHGKPVMINLLVALGGGTYRVKLHHVVQILPREPDYRPP